MKKVDAQSIALLFVTLSMCTLSCGQEVEGQNPTQEKHSLLFAEEIQMIRSSTPENMKGFYYVRLFDRLIPVPSRYVLLSRGNHELNSVLGAGDMDMVYGRMSLGKYEKLSDLYEVDESKHKIEKFNAYDLHVHIIRPKKEKKNRGPLFEMVYIFDDDEYLSIADDNQGLWRAMLESAWVR